MKNIIDKLENIDVDTRLKEVNNQLSTEKSAKVINDLVKEKRVLLNLKEERLSPGEAFTRKILPVIPSKYRSPIEMPNGTIFNPDVNVLLRNVGFANKSLKNAKKYLSKEDIQVAEKELYKTLEDLSGYDNPRNNNISDNLFASIKGKKGKPPKTGFFQNSVVKKRLNLTGRGVISPDPTLGIDEISVPYKMGFDLYNPFVLKGLKEIGFSTEEAKSNIKERTNVAKTILRDIAGEKPVAINRAPSIWKGSIVGLKPIFSEDNNIKIPNLVAPTLIGDFDGDSCLSFIELRHDRQWDYLIIDKLSFFLKQLWKIIKGR